MVGGGRVSVGMAVSAGKYGGDDYFLGQDDEYVSEYNPPPPPPGPPPNAPPGRSRGMSQAQAQGRGQVRGGKAGKAAGAGRARAGGSGSGRGRGGNVHEEEETFDPLAALKSYDQMAFKRPSGERIHAISGGVGMDARDEDEDEDGSQE